MQKNIFYLNKIKTHHIIYATSAAIIIDIFLIVLFFYIQNDFSHKTQYLQNSIDSIEESFLAKLDNYLSEKTNYILKDKLSSFSNELNEIQEKISIEKATLEKITLDKERSLRKLPRHINLDELSENYQKKIMQTKSSWDEIASFSTSQGKISFNKNNIDLMYFPNTDMIVSIRIGEDQSTKSPEIISAWINEAREAKIKEGYKSHEEQTNANIQSEKLIKEDDYFKWYFRSVSVLDQSGETYTAYRYFIEIGSLKRREQLETEQYNSLLGS